MKPCMTFACVCVCGSCWMDSCAQVGRTRVCDWRWPRIGTLVGILDSVLLVLFDGDPRPRNVCPQNLLRISSTWTRSLELRNSPICWPPVPPQPCSEPLSFLAVFLCGFFHVDRIRVIIGGWAGNTPVSATPTS